MRGQYHLQLLLLHLQPPPLLVQLVDGLIILRLLCLARASGYLLQGKLDLSLAKASASSLSVLLTWSNVFQQCRSQCRSRRCW